MFNSFTTEKGAEMIVKGWKKAGILDGTIELPCENPFGQYFNYIIAHFYYHIQ